MQGEKKNVPQPLLKKQSSVFLKKKKNHQTVFISINQNQDYDT